MINKIISRLKSEENGSVTILIAIGLTLFLGLSAMTVDIGLAEVTKFKLGNAADAAALAGAQELAALAGEPNPIISADKAKVKANDMLTANGFTKNDFQVQILNFNKKILVTAGKYETGIFSEGYPVATGIANIIGRDKIDVSARAVAEIGVPKSAVGIIPVGLSEDEMKGIPFYQELTMKVGAGSGETGWYGALALGGNGADEYRDAVIYGVSIPITLPQIVDQEEGNMAGPTDKGLAERIKQCKDQCKYPCTAQNHTENCPRLVTIPIYQVISSSQVKIVSFAMFFLSESTIEKGADKEGKDDKGVIKGQFIKAPVLGGGGIDTTGTVKDYGALGYQLTE